MTLSIANAKVLLVGLGGLGCPTAIGLTRAGVGALYIAEDDVIECSNLHRQVLYRDTDPGADKLETGIRALRRLCPESPTHIVPVRTRVLPDNARDLVRSVDLVVEGSDNFATKFLVNDACHLEQRMRVQGAAVRWVTTAFALGRTSEPCYRCLFEDIPRGIDAPNCAEAGVMGPVVGLGAALMVDFALGLLESEVDDSQKLDSQKLVGCLASYDGRTDRMRRRHIAPRKDCALCSSSRTIFDTRYENYVDEPCLGAG